MNVKSTLLSLIGACLLAGAGSTLATEATPSPDEQARAEDNAPEASAEDRQMLTPARRDENRTPRDTLLSDLKIHFI